MTKFGLSAFLKKVGAVKRMALPHAILFAFVLVAFGGVSSLAQVTSATILGTVTDPSGAVIKGAKVRVTNTATGIITDALTLGAGNFTIPYLPNGPYSLTVDSKGFKTFEATGINLNIGDSYRVDAKLVVGQESQVVTIVENAQALRTETSDLSATIDARTITETPNVNDNPLLTLVLIPGVVATGTFMDPNNVNTGDGARTNFTSFSVNGSQPLASNIQLDGAMDTSPYGNEIIVMPNLNAIAETHVITNSYSAEYGRSGGGVINLTTKSGTEKYHVAITEAFRNAALDSNSFGNRTFGLTAAGAPVRPKAPFSSNYFGGAIGGPLNIPHLYDSHGKTFFFASYAGLRRNQGVSTYFTVPTALERTGDFSQTQTLVSVNGTSMPYNVSIYEPFPSTTTVNTIAAGQYQVVRQQASYNGNLNVLPPSAIDATAQKLINYYPLPNITPVNADKTSNYFTNFVTNIHTDQLILRVDQDFSEGKRGFVHYTSDWTTSNPPDIFTDSATPHPEANNNGPTHQYIPTATVGFDWTLSPKDVVEFRANISRLNLVLVPINGGANTDFTALGFNPTEQVGFPTKAFPSISVGAYPSFGIGSFVYRQNHTTIFSFTPNYTKLMSKVTMKIGGEYAAILYNFTQPYKASMNFAAASAGFSAHCEGTNCPAVASTTPQGWAAANFLMGVNDGGLGSGEYVTGDPTEALKNGVWSGYVQNDWRVSRDLTLNLGIRYEFQGPITDRYNRLSQFDPNGVNETGTKGLYQFSGVNGDPRGQINRAWKNWAPRFGFAQRVNDKTVISGAYGISYVMTTGGGSGAQGFGSDGFAEPGYVQIRPNTGIQSGLDILQNPWTNAFSTGGIGAGANPLNPVLLGGSVTAFIRADNQTPYIQQYNLAIQRQLPSSMTLQVAYVGTKGTHLQIQQFPSNQTDDIPAATLNSAISTYVATGINPLSTKVANPFYPLIKGNTNLNAATVTQLYLDEPFPAYGSVTKFFDRVGESSYNSLQVSVKRSFRQGFQVTGAYTFSKNIDLGNGYGAAVQTGANQGTPYYAPGMRYLDRSISGFDQAHRGVVSYIWDIPVGRGHRILGNTKVVSQVIGGWKISGITTWASGNPLPITGTGFGRPNLIADPRIPKEDRVVGKTVVLPTGQSYTPQAGYRLRFNPDAFAGSVLAVASTSTPGATNNVANPYYFGNSPRLFSYLRGAGINDYAMSLAHNYVIKERYNLSVRLDAFNVMNRLQEGNPGTGFGGPNLVNTAVGGAPSTVGLNTSTTFGTFQTSTAQTSISQSANLPRYMQISGKFNF